LPAVTNGYGSFNQYVNFEGKGSTVLEVKLNFKDEIKNEYRSYEDTWKNTRRTKKFV